MTSNPPTTLVVSLIAVFATLFALGIYWMFRKREPRHLPTRSSGATRRPDPHAFDPYSDEWEAQAPYPEHAVQAVHQVSATGQPFFDERAPAELLYPGHDSRDRWEGWEEPQPETTSIPSSPSPSVPPSPASVPASAAVQVRCPHCLSSRIDTRNLARKAGSTIGSVAGATGAMTAALAGAETGAVVGSFAGPAGTIFGGLAGAVIAGLVGSAAGCAAGSVVGAAIDDNVLDNHLCLACGHAFSVPQD